ncbi:DUF4349 domain-containing protein [Mucilaginibacter sp. ZT4R22]|uniref:DUF4349 domain-containing protein n=1 Tax=Mucilaginibacter pankratovii TaxID=2772110 RepID=A0ABR7WMK3_9SPHI|nr:DUF4349 domain-containing protein [Mucilaginibacter pankratovii]MBD1363520.1 DUF4349 domain-containing protein [Mucilaginibacter pankratovii]
MKAYFFFFATSLLITGGCKNSNTNGVEQMVLDSVAMDKPKLAEVMMPPPVEKEDNQVYASVESAPEFVGDSESNTDVEVDAPVVNARVKTATDVTQKIIKQGDISFETADVKITRQRIISSLKKLKGYVQSDQETDDGEYGRKEYELNIKIPAVSFDAFFSSVSSTATKIDSKNISIRDVTTQFIDTKTRLENKLVLERRYLELLKRATKISEMLEIENKLAEIRTDIESNQGQLNYLNKQVDYSSLTIKFYTERPSQRETSVGFGYKIMKALGSGSSLLQEMFFGILSLWPYWFVVFALYLFIKRWRKRRHVARAA